MVVATADPPSAILRYQNFAMLQIIQGQWTLPDERTYIIEVGNLALGAPYINQSMSMWNTTLVDVTYLAGLPHTQGHTPSNSFGMHIGSVAMSIPPSIYLGGYDQSRVLGNVTVQNHNMEYFPIDLLDIGIGVAIGSSPFPFSSKSGLLAQGNSSIGNSMQVIVEPTAPFLYLPKSTCDAIAQYLPVHYNSYLGLYFWDTANPSYPTIISSAAYLSFTFRLNASKTETITINVPFSLLNLTLTPPLVIFQTQYFPCTPYGYGNAWQQLPTLGRAFLQAAFIGTNWGINNSETGAWFMSQAPGPTMPNPVVKSIGVNDNYIMPSINSWADTWKDTWTVQNGSASGSTPGSQNPVAPDRKGGSSSHLSNGSLVGIVLAIILACALAPAAIWRIWRKRRAAQKGDKDGPKPWQRVEMDAKEKQILELNNESRKFEADAGLTSELPSETKFMRSELMVEEKPQELPS